MKKLTTITFFILLLGFAHPISSSAEEDHTKAHEQQEQAQQDTVSSEKSSQAHKEIEAAEEKLLGHEAYQKLEAGHKLEENNPILFWSIVSIATLLVAMVVLYFVQKKKIY
ncbi:MAG: hypothetical protein JWM56_855 [Candidatus Peribacteria bacterium]|nr:hypothetical protein [Candidatus Peribacteria bacterium]